MAKKMNAHELREVLRRVEDALRDGFGPPWHRGGGGAITEAARRSVQDGTAGSLTAFKSRYASAVAEIGEPDWSQWRAPVYQGEAHSITALDPHVPPVSAVPEGKIRRVAVIGDLHDDPRLIDKTRFKALGAWVANSDADELVQLGDWMTCDSLSTHVEQASGQARKQPSYLADVESLAESLDAFHSGLGTRSIKKVMTIGNHEARVLRHEDRNPQLAGSLDPQWRILFIERGWSLRDYGEYYFIDGVGFTHHPINGAGRAYGGKTGNQRAGNEAVFSIVHGHDHKFDIASSPKIGPSRPVQVVSAGCALPWGWVEPYAKHSTTGWWWGALMLSIVGGDIVSIQATSMLEIINAKLV